MFWILIKWFIGIPIVKISEESVLLKISKTAKFIVIITIKAYELNVSTFLNKIKQITTNVM